MKKVVIINGPNLNLLGRREPDIYGDMTLRVLNKAIKKYAHGRRLSTIFFQSNHEGRIIDFIHSLRRRKIVGLIINPGAFTHYSYAIRDAIKAVNIVAVEVHLSDISAREPFRSISVIKDVCVSQIYGKGIGGYLEAIDILTNTGGNAPDHSQGSYPKKTNKSSRI